MSAPAQTIGAREGAVTAGWRQTAAAYFALTKPRIIELLLVTTFPAMVVAAEGLPNLWTVLATLQLPLGDQYAQCPPHGAVGRRPKHRMPNFGGGGGSELNDDVENLSFASAQRTPHMIGHMPASVERRVWCWC